LVNRIAITKIPTIIAIIPLKVSSDRVINYNIAPI
jgi:hypothetical protein